MTFLHSIRQWLEIALVIAIAIFVIMMFVKPPQFIKIPGTNTIINMKEATQQIQDKLKGIDELNKKIDELNSQIKKLQGQTIQHDIPEALKETDVRKSTNRMGGAW